MEQPDEIFDAVIIGAGLAGLVCAAKLSLDGMKVLLIEQHRVPGGYATTFRHKEYLIEVGLHEMDGFEGGNLKNKIFSELEVFNHVEFPKPDAFYRFVSKEADILVPHEVEKAKAVFTARFPHQAEGIATYFERISNFRKYRTRDNSEITSLGSYLDTILSDDLLKLALCGNLMAFSDDPYQITLDYFAQAQGTFHLSSGVFIRKGSQELSDYLMNFIRNHGGTVRLRHRADKIIIENNRAVGVQYHAVAAPEKTIRAAAGYTIANTSALNVTNELVGHQAMKEAIEKKEAGPSMFTLYLCFDKPLCDIGNPSYCTCLFPEDIRSLSDIGRTNRGRFEEKHFVLTDYSHIDSGLAPPGKSVAVIVCDDYASNWNSLAKPEYKIEKERVSRLFIDRLETYLPGMKEHLVWYDAATPLTLERYTRNPGGAIYGYAQSPANALHQGNDRFLENLYFASAWDKFGGGFSGAIYSGYFNAIEITRQERIKNQCEKHAKKD
jgi:phytoene dehydrogenase-like protein